MTQHHHDHHDGHQLADALAHVSEKIETVPEPGMDEKNIQFITIADRGVLWRRALLDAFLMKNVFRALVPEIGLTIDFDRGASRLLLGLFKKDREISVCVFDATGEYRIDIDGLEEIDVPLSVVHKLLENGRATEEELGVTRSELRLAKLIERCLKPIAKHEAERHEGREKSKSARPDAKSAKAEGSPKGERAVDRDEKGIPKGYDTSSLKLLDANLSEYVGKFGNRRRFAYWERSTNGAVSCVYVEVRLTEGDVALVCTGADGTLADQYREFRGATIMGSRFAEIAHGTSDATSDPAERFAEKLGGTLVALKDRLALERATRKSERPAAADCAAEAS